MGVAPDVSDTRAPGLRQAAGVERGTPTTSLKIIKNIYTLSSEAVAAGERSELCVRLCAYVLRIIPGAYGTKIICEQHTRRVTCS